MPGPAPTPTHLKLNHGNPGKRPINRREPKPPVGMPTCPRWLPREAKAEWRRITTLLAGMGMIHKADRGLIAAWCASWAQFHAATAAIGRVGYTTTTAKGDILQHPMVRIRAQAADHMIKLAGQFGLSPAARTRIETIGQDNKETDQLQDLLNRGTQVRKHTG